MPDRPGDPTMTADARILIVDDDPAAIEILEQALAGLGEVCFATGGADALALLAMTRSIWSCSMPTCRTWTVLPPAIS